MLARSMRWGVGAVLALLVAGCPAPTGRHRGIVPNDAICSNVETPSPGGVCSIDNDVCSLTQRCNGTGFQDFTCTCTQSRWSCVPGPCEMPALDGSVLACPPDPVHHGDACSARQGGMYCGGTLTCGGEPMVASCWCTGVFWSCSAPACLDGGPHDALDGSDDTAL